MCHSGWESEETWKKNFQWNWKEKHEGEKQAEDDFFEGAEKLLEVRFFGDSGDLGRLSRKRIEEILQLAR